MIHIKPSRLAVAALALAFVPGAAFAKDAGASGTTQMNALDFDCARLVAMDTELVPGVLYFISGYSQGQRDSGMSDAAGTGTDSSDASDTSEAADGDTTSTDTAASDTTDTDTPDGADAAAGDTDNTGEATAELSAIVGHFEIPVENMIVACEADPTRMVSDVIDEERTRRGGELSDGPEGTAVDRTDDSSSTDGATGDSGGSGSDSGASSESDSGSSN